MATEPDVVTYMQGAQPYAKVGNVDHYELDHSS